MEDYTILLLDVNKKKIMKRMLLFFFFFLFQMILFAQQSTESITVFDASTFQMYSWDGYKYEINGPKQTARYKIYWYVNELTIASITGMTIIGNGEPQTSGGYDSEKGYSYEDFLFNGIYTRTGQNCSVRVRFYKNLSFWSIQFNVGNYAILWEGNFKKEFILKR